MSTQLLLVGGTDAEGRESSTPHPEARLHLTRRGRVVFGALATVAVAGLLALAAAFAAPQASAADVASGGDRFHYVVAQPGTSLWSLATELDPKADPRDVVAEIVQLNQLGGSGVQAGQALAVPMRYADNPITVPAAELGLD